MQVVHDAFVPLLLVNRQRITGVDKLMKGVLDYSLGILNFLIALPLMGIISAALQLTTRDTVL